MKNKNDLSAGFVKYYINLDYVFDPEEMKFIMHMSRISYFASLGDNTNWSGCFLKERLRMKRRVFERCTKRFIELRLLELIPCKGNRCYYRWNMPLYEKLVQILCSTNNSKAIVEFYQQMFVIEKRTIESITNDDTEKLSKTRIKRKSDL